MVFFRRKKPQAGATPDTPSSPVNDSSESTSSSEIRATETSPSNTQAIQPSEQSPSGQRPRRINPMAMQDPRDIPGNIISTIRRDQPQRPSRTDSG